jgi:hypothetical protein
VGKTAITKTQTPTAESIFRHAFYFHFAAGLLYKHTVAKFHLSERFGAPFTAPCSLPYIVVIGFATELYFKSLVTLETGNYPKIHELEKLYGLVSVSRQKRIKELFSEKFNRINYTALLQDNRLPVDPKEFEIEAALRRLNESFVEWRYSFEGIILEENVDIKTSFGDDALCDAVLCAILEVKPDWQKIIDDRCTPTTSLIH